MNKLHNSNNEDGNEPFDNATCKELARRAAERFLNEREDILEKIEEDGFPHYGVSFAIAEYLPAKMPDRVTWGYKVTPDVLNRRFGVGKWTTESRPKRNGEGVTQWTVTVAKERQQKQEKDEKRLARENVDSLIERVAQEALQTLTQLRVLIDERERMNEGSC